MVAAPLTWKFVKPTTGGWWNEATLPDGRVAVVGPGLRHRWVLAIDGKRIRTFTNPYDAKAAAEEMVTPIDVETVQRPYQERERNEARRKNKALEPCFLCGRSTSETLFVRLRTDGYLVPVEAEVPEADDQGFFSIGPECAKKLPKGHVSRGVA